jgi:hypothetical protein
VTPYFLDLIVHEISNHIANVLGATSIAAIDFD